MNKLAIFKPHIFLLSLVFAFMIIIPVTATINVTVDEVGESYIKWSWNSGLSLINLSVDGYEIQHFDNKDNKFILSELEPMEKHFIAVYTSTDSGYNVTNTTSSNKSSDKFWDYILIYLFFILGIVCLIGGFYENFIALGASLFGFLLIIESLNVSLISATLGVILIFSGIFVMFRE